MAQSSWSINITNDGSGNFTGALLRNPTAASGGTSVNSTTGNSMDLAVSRTDPGIIVELAKALLKDDRAAGN